MASNEPKKRSITGNLVANMLTEREDDFTFNVTYVANRSIEDLCKIAANGKSKFSASELLSAYTEFKGGSQGRIILSFYRRSPSNRITLSSTIIVEILKNYINEHGNK